MANLAIDADSSCNDELCASFRSNIEKEAEEILICAMRFQTHRFSQTQNRSFHPFIFQ